MTWYIFLSHDSCFLPPFFSNTSQNLSVSSSAGSTYTPSTPTSTKNKQVRFRRQLNGNTPTSSPMSSYAASSSLLTDASLEEISLDDNNEVTSVWEEEIKRKQIISQEYFGVKNLINTVKNKIFQKNDNIWNKNKEKQNEIYSFFQPFEFQISAFELLVQRLKNNPLLRQEISLQSLKEGVQNYEKKFDQEFELFMEKLKIVQ